MATAELQRHSETVTVERTFVWRIIKAYDEFTPLEMVYGTGFELPYTDQPSLLEVQIELNTNRSHIWMIEEDGNKDRDPTKVHVRIYRRGGVAENDNEFEVYGKVRYNAVRS